MKKTIVLCSGGLDSSTLLYMQRKTFDDSDILVLFFNYGQKNYEKEKQALQDIVPSSINILELNIVDVFKQSPSSLINKDAIPYKAFMKNDELNVIPNQITVEFRNGVFVSAAISIAQQLYLNDTVDIVLGVYYNTPEFFDCSEIFLKAYNKIAELQTDGRHHVLAPFGNLNKEEVLELAKILEIPVEKTWSCYLGKSNPCGYCAACMDRMFYQTT